MRTFICAVVLSAVAGCAATGRPQGDFSSTTVHFGIVVSDIDKAADFYRNGLGFTEAPGFDVPVSMGGDSGLTDYKPFHVRVMKLGEGENATQVKLMQFKDAPGAKAPNDFIHTTLGMSYMTVLVTDIDKAVDRAKRAGAPPLAKGPILLPEGFPKGVYLALVRDPDGNMIELVGPKAEAD